MRIKIDKPIRLIELFAGIGSQAMSLRDLNANFEMYKVLEFDKFAIKSYNSIHNTNFHPIDINEINGNDLGITDRDKYCYIMTYSFPCQDLSIAGKKTGMSKNSNTRSGLLWEVERLSSETKELPQILLMENVTQIHSKKNMPDFQKWIDFLEPKGYKNYWNDLNAKDFGIPQSRNRCFMLSILGDYEYEFPNKLDLEKHMCDILQDDEIDDGYYLYSEKAKMLIDNIVSKNNILFGNKNDKIQLFGTMDSKYESTNRVYYTTGISPTINTCQGGNRETKIIEIALLSRNLVGKQNNIHLKSTNCIKIICARDYHGFHNRDSNTIIRIETFNKLNNNSKKFVYNIDGIQYLIRIRKLTPKEHWRLMGFSDNDFEKAKSVNSNTQLYKQAGNAIVKQVLMEIFRQIL